MFKAIGKGSVTPLTLKSQQVYKLAVLCGQQGDLRTREGTGSHRMQTARVCFELDGNP